MLIKHFRKLMSLFFILALPTALDASIVITEVMYDLEGSDAGREWIEVENTSASPIDLTLWKLFEAEANHKIAAVSGNELPPGSLAVIADDPEKFKADNPSYAGLLFDSVFSLGNEGEGLAMKDGDLAVSDSISYDAAVGGKGNGMTLQRHDGIWAEAAPTPGGRGGETDPSQPAEDKGKESDAKSGDVPSKDDSGPKDAPRSSHSSQSVANTSYDEPEFVVTSGRPRLGFAGSPLAFESKIKSSKNIPAGNSISSVWSMGDGTQRYGQHISHTYEYPGDYIVVLNSDHGGAHAVSKVRVRIVEPQAALRIFDDYVKIENRSPDELNIGKWSLSSQKERFVIPDDTIILPRSSIKVPYSVSRLSNPAFVRLDKPTGKEAALALNGLTVSDPQEVPESIVLPQGLSEQAFRRNLAAALKAASMAPIDDNTQSSFQIEAFKPKQGR